MTDMKKISRREIPIHSRALRISLLPVAADGRAEPIVADLCLVAKSSAAPLRGPHWQVHSTPAVRFRYRRHLFPQRRKLSLERRSIMLGPARGIEVELAAGGGRKTTPFNRGPAVVHF